MSDRAKGGGSLTPLKQAFLAMEEMQARLDALENRAAEPIAVIGIGCRFPGKVDDADSYWRLLVDGVDAITGVPPGRWDQKRYYDPDPESPGKTYAREGGFIDRIDEFDPAFFGIAPREAARMDPQQRLLLEVSWEALEHAAQAPDKLEGSKTGVFFGVCSSDYSFLQVTQNDSTLIDTYYASGIAHSIASGRVSYVLGLQGPSLSIDTACSSSLVAVHLACQSLAAGECRMALAGGVNAILSHENTIAFSKLRILGPGGRCRTFDAQADGIARGEGCGVVVLKRLKDAQADGDRILAIVRGSAVNQDGASSGITAPNGPAQEAVIRETLERARLEPGQVGYVEAHGTGTILGDPIEVQALAKALRPDRHGDGPLLVGSVKTNFGHLEGAAGIAGFIKAALVVHHGEIPPHLHFTTPNPHIPWDELPIEVPVRRTKWPGPGERIAGVSSFGFSGTNAHVLVAEPPADTRTSTCMRPQHVLCVSAQTATALSRLGERYAALLAERPDQFADICYTSCIGRAHQGQRFAVAAPDAGAARAALAALRQAPAADGSPHAEAPRVAFLFTGQGAQYTGMGRQLYDTEPQFRRTLDRCDEILRPYLGRSLLDALFDARHAEDLNETSLTQPALFAIEYAVADLWQSWGVRPAALLGHSVGEYVAACHAGVFSLEDGLKLIAARGRLMQGLARDGSMAAVFAPEERVRPSVDRFPGEVSVAAINAPENTVISGRRETVDALLAEFEGLGIAAQPLNVSHAFHSPLMQPMLEEFSRIAREIDYRPGRGRIVSNITAKLGPARELATPDYWIRHVLAPVRFAGGFNALLASGTRAVIEVGPHPTLIGLAMQSCPPAAAEAPVWLPSLRRGSSDWEQLAQTAAAAHVAGIAIDWRAFYDGCGHRKVSLPGYPFERKRYWLAPPSATPATPARRTDAPNDLPGTRLRSPNRAVTTYESTWSRDEPPFLADHVVHGQVVVPATAYLELSMAAAFRLFGPGMHRLESVTISQAMMLREDAQALGQLVVTGTPGGARAEFFSVDAAAEDEVTWQRHFSATIVAGANAAVTRGEGPDAIRRRCSETIGGADHYAGLRARGLAFGPRFTGVTEISIGAAEALGRVCRITDPRDTRDYQVDPAFLDAALQVVSGAVTHAAGVDPGAVYLPISLDRLTRYAAWPPSVWSHARLRGSETVAGTSFSCDLRVFDDAGRTLAEMEGLLFKRIEASQWAAEREPEWLNWLYEIEWCAADAAARAELGEVRPAELAKPLLERLESLRAEVGMPDYDRLWARLEGLCTAYVLDALRPWSESLAAGQQVTAAGLAERLAVLPRHRRLLDRFLEILVEDGVLKPAPGGFVVSKRPRLEDPSPAIEELRLAQPACTAQLELVRRCGSRLGEALRGDCDPLDLLFPGGSLADAERLYRESPFARLYRHLSRQAIEVVVGAAGGPLRILEIGAGTGGTTDAVLPALPATTHYCFTDMSPVFLEEAREKFSRFPFVEYGLLNIELDPDGQGFAGRQFDVIIAASMIHATRDLRQSLEHVKQLLVPGGLLILLEGTRPERWIDVTFGLTDGWWRFDDGVRSDYPLLSRERWLRLLEETGFETTSSVPAEDRGEVLLFSKLAGGALRVEPDGGGLWAVLGAGDTLTGELCERLRARGRRSVPLDREAVFADGAGPAAVTRALAKAADGSGQALEGVVYVASGTDSSMVDDVRANAAALLHLVQALVIEGAGRTPRLVILTDRARATGPGSNGVNLAHAPLWGLGQVVTEEHPELECLRVDLDLQAGAPDLGRLVDLLLAAPAEDQLALRNGELRVPRLTRRAAPATAAPTRGNRGAEDSVELVIGRRGDLASIGPRSCGRRGPAAGQLEIEVMAAGLGFRDVLNAVGMRSDEVPLGSEFAGRVAAIGEGVTGFAPGDDVIGVGVGCFRSFVTVPEAWVARMPAGTPYSEAAALPSAYLTASYALERVGGLRAGQKVLIHTAAGGVGLAAVRLAQRAGAEIYATAGSPEKRAFLRSLGLQNVYDSRTLEFAERIREALPQGLDRVLNTLSGDFVDRSLALLASGGRFLEIGKSDLRSAEEIGRRHPGVGYFAIDLVQVCESDPALIRAMLLDLSGAIAASSLPLLPCRPFELAEASEAFRFMARARHIGKVVLDWPRARTAPVTGDVPRIRADASYLVTGAFGGLGLLTARWLVERGARHLLLLGRREPHPDAASVLHELEARGVSITTASADVADFETVETLLGEVPASRPLRGVFHAAGVLDDGVLAQQTLDKFERVFAPKVAGSWNLHRLTKDEPLDFYVLYSSTASLLGSPGQGNHAAANAFLDALAAERRRLGLPGLSINWGPWSVVGAAASLGERGERRFEEHGLGRIAPEEGIAILERLVLGEHPAQVGVVPVVWSRYLARSGAGRTPRFLSRLAEKEAPAGSARGGVAAAAARLPALLAQALPAERTGLMERHVGLRAATVLGLDPQQTVDKRRPLSEMGLDSLMAVELRNLLTADLGRAQALPATLIFKYPTVEALAKYLLAELALAESTAAAVTDGKPEDLEEVENLSDEQARQLIADELNSLAELDLDEASAT